ncbi:phosphogluconate dehydratase, partial [Azospirillum brasilense]|nr:phosphogluconate dehydratase [Azospirillum brasilense]
VLPSGWGHRARRRGGPGAPAPGGGGARHASYPGPRGRGGGERGRGAAVRRGADPAVLAPVASPMAAEGGLRVLSGPLGRAVVKVSAVKPDHRVIEAPARVFTDQESVQAAFRRGELHRDVVVVVRFQGPKANGMPELHKLTPPLGVLQDLGYRVALVTDGRMSGASGKVPAAIHVTPEAAAGGPLGRVRDGDMLRLDTERGTLEVLVDDAEWTARPLADAPADAGVGCGRELFGVFRRAVGSAEAGASVFG